MESALTKPEMDAAFQLIELSGGCADDLRVYWVNFPASAEEDEERSAADSSLSSSSGLINREKSVSDDEDDVLPRSKARFESLASIYRRTDRALIKRRRAAKRPRF